MKITVLSYIYPGIIISAKWCPLLTAYELCAVYDIYLKLIITIALQVYVWLTMLAHLHSSFTFFVYGCTNPEFRRTLMDIMHKMKTCFGPNKSTGRYTQRVVCHKTHIFKKVKGHCATKSIGFHVFGHFLHSDHIDSKLHMLHVLIDYFIYFEQLFWLLWEIMCMCFSSGNGERHERGGL